MLFIKILNKIVINSVINRKFFFCNINFVATILEVILINGREKHEDDKIYHMRLTVEKLERGFVNAITPRKRDELTLYHISPIRFTVAEAVEELMEDIARIGNTSFRALTSGLVERLEIVVRFLAILEMYKQGFIELDQVDRFGDITVLWTGIGTGNESMAEIDSYEG